MPWINKNVKLPSLFNTAEQVRWTEILPYQLNTKLSYPSAGTTCYPWKIAPIEIYVQHLAHKPVILTVESCRGKAVAIQFLKHHVPKLTFISSITSQLLKTLFYVTCQAHGLRLCSIWTRKLRRACKQPQEREEALGIVHVFSREICCYQLWRQSLLINCLSKLLDVNR